MTLAPSFSPAIPFPAPVARPALVALALESTSADVSELVTFASRLDAHAAREGRRVSAMGVVAKAFLVASLRHPAVDARWPLLPARHGVRLSELTEALEGADAATPIPEDAAVLSIGSIVENTDAASLELRLTLELRLAFDPRRTDAIEAHRFVEELAGLLADPWELVVQS